MMIGFLCRRAPVQKPGLKPGFCMHVFYISHLAKPPSFGCHYKPVRWL